MVSDFTWNKFVSNVQQWSAERGIYEHSTATAQLFKAFSEAGELADAVIKGDKEALKDAIGDVAVCIVNFAYMTDQPTLIDLRETHFEDLMAEVPMLFKSLFEQEVWSMLEDLVIISNTAKLNFLECCEHAWNEIKDRKGRMVEGGAFVKD